MSDKNCIFREAMLAFPEILGLVVLPAGHTRRGYNLYRLTLAPLPAVTLAISEEEAVVWEVAPHPQGYSASPVEKITGRYRLPEDISSLRDHLERIAESTRTYMVKAQRLRGRGQVEVRIRGKEYTLDRAYIVRHEAGFERGQEVWVGLVRAYARKLGLLGEVGHGQE